jgi:RimJ/RimL family protein N-acetyltransferase
VKEQAMSWLQPTTLRSSLVVLAPLDYRHRDDLIEAVKDGEQFKLWYTAVPAPETMGLQIELRLSQQAAGITLPFAIIDSATGKAVGMTNYLNVESVNRHVEIGGTWYRRSLQRTGFNAQAKLLLLAHFFWSLICLGVWFRTHFFNHQSRRAIERLGAKLDGILRSHELATNGTLRDTCSCSIIAGEWPTVKAHLTSQLTQPRAVS